MARDMVPLKRFSDWFEALAAGGSADNAMCRPFGTKIIDGGNAHQFREPGAGAIDAALDGAHRATANFGGLYIGKSFRADEDERLPLIFRELSERRLEVWHIHVAGLLGVR